MYTVSRDSPPCVLTSLAVLLGWWGAGCEIYTSKEKRGQVETQRWTWQLTPWLCHQRREINGERKTSKGKLTIFLKAARKFLIISTQRPVTSTEKLSHTLTHIHQHLHTQWPRPNLCKPSSPLRARTKLDGKRKIMSSLFAAVKGQ